MGDNANVDWAWKNTIVGEGYQAKGVIRQRTAQSCQVKVVNMSAVPASKSSAAPAPAPTTATAPAPVQRSEDRTKRDRDDLDDEAGAHRGDKKRKKDNKDSSSKHKKSKKDHKGSKHDRDRAGSERDSFNPLLQCLASRLSNKTRIFTLENE